MSDLVNVIVESIVGLAEPGEFFLNLEYARGQIELLDRTMEALGDTRTSEERRPAIIQELAEKTDSVVPNEWLPKSISSLKRI